MPQPPTAPDFTLRGGHYVVIGAGQGIGAALCRAIAGLGGSVTAVDREERLASAIADETGGRGACCDATDAAALTELLISLDDDRPFHGAVDVVGAASRRHPRDFDAAGWRKELDVNLSHAATLGTVLAPRMAERPDGGALVFVSSAITPYGTHVTPAYHAAKAALSSWVRSLAVSFGPDGVRANAVCPGPTLTPRMAAGWDEATRAAVRDRTAIKRIAEPDDIAAAAVFLLGPAARCITGVELFVDGGAAVRDPYYGDPANASFADDIAR